MSFLTHVMRPHLPPHPDTTLPSHVPPPFPMIPTTNHDPMTETVAMVPQHHHKKYFHEMARSVATTNIKYPVKANLDSRKSVSGMPGPCFWALFPFAFSGSRFLVPVSPSRTWVPTQVNFNITNFVIAGDSMTVFDQRKSCCLFAFGEVVFRRIEPQLLDDVVVFCIGRQPFDDTVV